MALMSVSFDTVTKKLSVAVDGEELQDVSSVSFWERYGEDYEGMFEASIVMESKKNPDTGIMERRHLYASESESAKKARLLDTVTESAYAGFIQSSQNVGVTDAIANYMAR